MESLSVHDNNVYQYVVDFDKKEIVFKTEFEKREFVDIVFSEVFAYIFEDTIIGCIIFDIEESSVDEFINYFGEGYILDHKNYGWPLDFNDLDDLKAKMDANGIKIYNVLSSYGMSGFVLAQSMEYVKKDRKG